jgi:hypothetical protein
VIETEDDTHGVEVEAAVDLEVFVCLKTSSGGMCRSVACSIHRAAL